jgi:hypothetical protein
METVKAGNKGYGAEIAVVTYCKGKRDSPEKPKLRILLVRFIAIAIINNLLFHKLFIVANNCMSISRRVEVVVTVW